MKAGASETGIDFERFRLRRFIEELRRSGELEVRAGNADLAEVAPALEGNAKAVLFERVGNEGAQLVGGRHLTRTDTAQLNALHTEVMVWHALETAVREAKAVYAREKDGRYALKAL